MVLTISGWQEKEEALERVLSVFCKISRRTGNPSQLALTYVAALIFALISFSFKGAKYNSLCLYKTSLSEALELFLP